MTETAALRALLEWQIDLGADEAIGDVPVDRYAAEAEAAARARAGASPRAPARSEPAHETAQAARGPVAVAAPAVAAAGATGVEAAVAEAEALARGARDLAALRAAMAGYEHCDLRLGARNLVFADGLAGARVMIMGEAPGREEDRLGLPFVGAAGQLLDRMFAAIGLTRAGASAQSGLYISNILPWRPPGNREPSPAELAMFRPFALRHVELAAPEFVVLMGNTPCAALLGQRGILKLRGHWADLAGRPCLPMCHPAYLLRTPIAKREAWADLQALRARLEATT